MLSDAEKRGLLEMARSTAVMLTTEKLGTFAPYRICKPTGIGTYILSPDAGQTLRDGLSGAGRRVLLAEPDPLKEPI